MAVPVMSFKASIDPTDKTKLILTDNSDPKDTNIFAKDWYITKSDGTVDHIPVVGTMGNVAVYKMPKDLAVVVKLGYNHNPVNPSSGFTLSVNVAAAPILTDALHDLRKNFLDKMEISDCTREQLVDQIRTVETYLEAGEENASTDIVAAQKSFDLGNKYANEYKS